MSGAGSPSQTMCADLLRRWGAPFPQYANDIHHYPRSTGVERCPRLLVRPTTPPSRAPRTDPGALPDNCPLDSASRGPRSERSALTSTASSCIRCRSEKCREARAHCQCAGCSARRGRFSVSGCWTKTRRHLFRRARLLVCRVVANPPKLCLWHGWDRVSSLCRDSRRVDAPPQIGPSSMISWPQRPTGGPCSERVRESRVVPGHLLVACRLGHEDLRSRSATSLVGPATTGSFARLTDPSAPA